MLEKRLVVLKKSVRVFEPTIKDSVMLGRSGKWLRAGTAIMVGGAAKRSYGHRDIDVLQVLNTDKVFFIIESELEEDPWYLIPPTDDTNDQFLDVKTV